MAVRPLRAFKIADTDREQIALQPPSAAAPMSPTVTFILGLCGSGKTWMAGRIRADIRFDEGFLQDESQQKELVESLAAGRDAVVVEIGFCDERNRQRILASLAGLPALRVRWICFEN